MYKTYMYCMYVYIIVHMVYKYIDCCKLCNYLMTTGEIGARITQ